MRTNSHFGFRFLMGFLAAGFLLSVAQAAEVGSRDQVGVARSTHKLPVYVATVIGLNVSGNVPDARQFGRTPSRSAASGRIWKTCTALILESNCSTYA
jgi:hypothetical protein